MTWDLGPEGLAVLAFMSLGFGVFAQLMFWSRPMWWVGLAATAAFFLFGLLVSEVWFGWATEAELQPNIDGLSFDEVMLGYLIGIPAVLIVRYLAYRDRPHRPMSA